MKLSPTQQALWRENELSLLKGLEARAKELVVACEHINPLLEEAIGGWANADEDTQNYRMSLVRIHQDIKALDEHREILARLMAKKDG